LAREYGAAICLDKTELGKELVPAIRAALERLSKWRRAFDKHPRSDVLGGSFRDEDLKPGFSTHQRDFFLTSHWA
jgi:hypothetical protein